VESLLRRGVPPDQIVAVGRNVARAADGLHPSVPTVGQECSNRTGSRAGSRMPVRVCRRTSDAGDGLVDKGGACG
jgi:hypothetical protein